MNEANSTYKKVIFSVIAVTAYLVLNKIMTAVDLKTIWRVRQNNCSRSSFGSRSF